MHVDCYRFCAFDYMFMSIPCDSSRPSPLTLMDLSPLPLLLDATEDLLPRPTPQLGVWSLYQSYRRPRYGSLSPSLSHRLWESPGFSPLQPSDTSFLDPVRPQDWAAGTITLLSAIRVSTYVMHISFEYYPVIGYLQTLYMLTLSYLLCYHSIYKRFISESIFTLTPLIMGWGKPTTLNLAGSSISGRGGRSSHSEIVGITSLHHLLHFHPLTPPCRNPGMSRRGGAREAAGPRAPIQSAATTRLESTAPDPPPDPGETAEPSLPPAVTSGSPAASVTSTGRRPLRGSSSTPRSSAPATPSGSRTGRRHRGNPPAASEEDIRTLVSQLLEERLASRSISALPPAQPLQDDPPTPDPEPIDARLPTASGAGAPDPGGDPPDDDDPFGDSGSSSTPPPRRTPACTLLPILGPNRSEE